jgi:hypothetical protein
MNQNRVEVEQKIIEISFGLYPSFFIKKIMNDFSLPRSFNEMAF